MHGAGDASAGMRAGSIGARGTRPSSHAAAGAAILAAASVQASSRSSIKLPAIRSSEITTCDAPARRSNAPPYENSRAEWHCGICASTLYGWSVASVNVGALLGAEPGVTFGLSWDRTSTTNFEWCVPPDLDCVEFTITRAANGTVTLTYLGVLDFDQNYYPSRNGDPPGNQNSQNFQHHGGDHFDGGMQHGGISTPQMPECGFAAHPFQVITRDGRAHSFRRRRAPSPRERNGPRRTIADLQTQKKPRRSAGFCTFTDFAGLSTGGRRSTQYLA